MMALMILIVNLKSCLDDLSPAFSETERALDWLAECKKDVICWDEGF